MKQKRLSDYLEMTFFSDLYLLKYLRELRKANEKIKKKKSKRLIKY